MKLSISLFVQLALIIAAALMAAVQSKPTHEALVGTPHLFTEYDYPVDPHRSQKLSPAFQSANGVRGERLVAFFGTGGLRSVERPVIAIPHHHGR